MPIVAKVFSSQPTQIPAPMVIFIGANGTPIAEKTGASEYIGNKLLAADFFLDVIWSDGESEMLANLAMNGSTRYAFLRAGQPTIIDVPDKDTGLYRYFDGHTPGVFSAYQALVNADSQFNDPPPSWITSPYASPWLAPSTTPELMKPLSPVTKEVKDQAWSDVAHNVDDAIAGTVSMMRTAIAQLRSVFPTTKIYVVGYGLAGSVAYQLAKLSVGKPEDPSRIDGAVILGGRQASFEPWPVGQRPAVYSIVGLNDQFLRWQDAKMSADIAGGKNIVVPFAGHALADLKGALNLTLKEIVG